MVAASFAVRNGDVVQINVPSDTNMRAPKSRSLAKRMDWVS